MHLSSSFLRPPVELLIRDDRRCCCGGLRAAQVRLSAIADQLLLQHGIHLAPPPDGSARTAAAASPANEAQRQAAMRLYSLVRIGRPAAAAVFPAA